MRNEQVSSQIEKPEVVFFGSEDWSEDQEETGEDVVVTESKKDKQGRSCAIRRSIEERAEERRLNALIADYDFKDLD